MFIILINFQSAWLILCLFYVSMLTLLYLSHSNELAIFDRLFICGISSGLIIMSIPILTGFIRASLTGSRFLAEAQFVKENLYDIFSPKNA